MAEHSVSHVAMYKLNLVPNPPEGYVKGQTLPITEDDTLNGAL